MKKLILLYLLFIFSSVKAQKYVFNTLTKYNEIIIYSNSYIDSYSIGINKYKSSITADLYDYKTLKIHRFLVKESKVKGEILFDFEYENTSNINNLNKNDYSKYVCDFDYFELNDSVKRVNLKVYRNSKKKKPIMDYELRIKKYHANLFPAFRISCLHPYEFLSKLNSFQNGLVTYAKENTLSGNQLEYKLEVLKKVNFELIIPD